MVLIRSKKNNLIKIPQFTNEITWENYCDFSSSPKNKFWAIGDLGGITDDDKEIINEICLTSYEGMRHKADEFRFGEFHFHSSLSLGEFITVMDILDNSDRRKKILKQQKTKGQIKLSDIEFTRAVKIVCTLFRRKRESLPIPPNSTAFIENRAKEINSIIPFSVVYSINNFIETMFEKWANDPKFYYFFNGSDEILTGEAAKRKLIHELKRKVAKDKIGWNILLNPVLSGGAFGTKLKEVWNAPASNVLCWLSAQNAANI